MVPLFPFHEYWWFYAGFTVLVATFLAIDLGLFHRKAHEVRFREALVWTMVWVCLALLFSFGLYRYAAWKFGAPAAKQVGLEFLTGYVVEWSLSLDNIFVFVLVFRHFAIPALSQHRILYFGILGALIFRGVFIALGATLLQYGWIAIMFGFFLVFTGLQMMLSAELPPRPERSLIIRLVRKVLPVAAEPEERRFLVRRRGKLYATPLLLTLVFIEATDILFAIDSVPAIFSITREPLIVYTSNVFAILGLRAMYFLLAGAVTKFHLLRYGLALILIFVGLKMAWLNAAWNGHFPIGISLGVIIAVLAGSIGLSLAFPVVRAPADPGRR